MKKKHKKLAVAGIALGLVGGAAYAWYRKYSDEKSQAVTGFRGLGALDYHVPVAIRNLPLNSLRSQLPINSPAYLHAAQEAMNGTGHNVMLPKSMLITKWKQQPGAGGFGNSVTALMAAMRYDNGILDEMRQPELRAPTLTAKQFADQIVTLPSGGGARVEDPIARGLSQQSDVTAYELNMLSDAAAYVPFESTEFAAMRPQTPAQEGASSTLVWDGSQLRMIPTEG